MTTAPTSLSDAASLNGQPPGADSDAPYVGLSYYTEADAWLFFGRDPERQVIMGNLRASRLTLLYAQSGVGKSSLLRAGVAARLRELAAESLAGSGSAPHVPVVFSAWKDDPTQELIDAILQATNALLGEEHSQRDLPRDSLRSAIQVASLALDQAVASDGSERAGSTLLVILDQFEEYFLYRGRGIQIERFADELAECINDSGLRANFLISIREDAYSALGDLLRGRLSNVYNNYLHLEYLDAQAARGAIAKPIGCYNASRPASEHMAIEPGLIEAVLEQVQRSPDEYASEGEGTAPVPGPHRTEIATPYLQLVMIALWEREAAEGSSVLRLATLEQLHGTESIVARHLSQALAKLRPADRELAVDVLHHLVTPSGSKVALEVADLNAYTGHPASRIAEVLQALAGPARILREIPPAPGKSGDDQNARRFEIYHDVLAGPINDAVSESARRRLETEKDAAEQLARKERKRARTFRALAIAALVLLVAAVGAVILAEVEKNRAHTAQVTSRAREFAAEAQSGFLSGDLQRGVLLSVQAYRTRPMADARYALISALEATQNMVAYLAGQSGQISGVAYSPDGTTLASSSMNRTVALWNTRTGQREAVLRGHTAQVTGVAYSPDGRTIASSDGNGVVILWDARHAGRHRALPSRNVPIETLTFAPSGELLATAQDDGRVSIWNPATGRLLRTLPVGSQIVYAVAFSSDGRQLVTGSAGGAIDMFDTATGKRLRVLHAGSDVNGLALNRNGTLLAAAVGSGVDLYNMRSGRIVRVLHPNTGTVQTVAFNSDGSRVAAGTAGSGANSTPTATIWDATSGRLLKLLAAPTVLTSINAVAFSPDGATLASGGTSTAGTDSSLILWDARPGAGFRVLTGSTGAVTGVAYSPTGARLAATGDASNVVIWDLQSGVKRTVALSAPGETVAFSPDGHTIAAGADDGTVTLWDASSGHRLLVLSHQQDAVFAVAFSPNGQLLASGSADQTVDIYDARTGRLVRALSGHTDQVSAVAFSPDGRLLASGGNDDLINLWDVASGRRVRTLTATRPVAAVAFSPDGRTLASAGADEVVSLWNVSTGQLEGAPFAGHQDNITGLAFSRDGRYLVSGSGDHSALVWNLATGLAVPVGGHTGGIRGVALSPDGSTVVAGGSDGTVTMQQVPAGMDATTISQRLCSVVRRNLTPVEWRQFVPDEPYQRTCQ